MANFTPEYERTLLLEGGYRLTNDPDDRGRMTYAGISRVAHPGWNGWLYIDDKDFDNPRLTAEVRSLYKTMYWDKIKGDSIVAQGVASAIYDCSVNMGTRVATKLAQVVINVTPDGIIGPKTLAHINTYTDKKDIELFSLKYAVAKLARYSAICAKAPEQTKYLRGWLNRTIEGLT